MQYYLNKDSFQTLLVNPKVSRLDKLLLILFWDSESEKPISKIKEIGSENGLRECLKWNISDTLSKGKGKASLIKGNWVLTVPGKAYLAKQNYLEEKKSIVKNDVADLRNHLISISNPQTRSFIEEAINCLETGQKRAAVVLSWVGATAVLYDEVVKKHLSAFNSEALKRDAKWKNATTSDDLGKMKEFDFLNILESISVIGKNVKQELQQCLQLRNGCGHPNTLAIGIRKVSAHIEILMLNVFSKF